MQEEFDEDGDCREGEQLAVTVIVHGEFIPTLYNDNNEKQSKKNAALLKCE